MKFGMSTLSCPAWTLEQVAEAAQDYGYHGVELRILDGEVITPDLVRRNLGRLRQLFGAGTPELVGLGTSVRVAIADPEARAAQQRDLLDFITLAQELRVPMLRVFGGRREEGDSEAAAIERAAEFLQRCASAAERAGVTVALETHDDFSRSKAVAAAIERVRSSAIGALWDTHHPYRMGENLAEVWANLANRLVHVHVKDARRRPDGEWELVLLGEGEVPCREIVRALALRGYRGYVVVEWEKKWHPEIVDPEIALPQHLARLREWTADLI